MFIYDGSFEGLLTAVFEAYRLRDFADITPAENYQKGLFEEARRVVSAADKAARVSARLLALGGDVLRVVQYCFLAGLADKEKIIFAYIRRTLSAGRSLNGNYADPVVAAALACLKKVAREAERLKGLLRFQELRDGSFYAAIEPEHCILPLLAGHCRARFSGQGWLIHDARRGIALVYQDGDLQLFDNSAVHNARDKHAAHELAYQELWKIFHQNIAIAGRKNPKLQKQFMPVRYWKYLTEKN